MTHEFPFFSFLCRCMPLIYHSFFSPTLHSLLLKLPEVNYTSRSAPLIPSSQSWYLSGFGAWSWKHRPGDWKRGCFLLNRRERELEILFIKKTAHAGDGGRERELNISAFSRVLIKCPCPYIEEEPSIGIGQRPDSVTPPPPPLCWELR